MKNKKIEITADNFGELLLQSANEALDHSKEKTIAELQKENEELKAKLAKAKEGLRFYGTYTPDLFCEGILEMHTDIEKGECGHVKFGTKARKTLAELGE